MEEQPTKSLSLEKRLFKITVITYAILAFVAVTPITGLIVYIPFFCTGLLWLYTGSIIVAVIFPASIFLAKRKGTSVLHAMLSAFRRAAIGFGALGVLMWASVFVVPGYKSFTLGYWLHAKIWLNVAQIRQWASGQNGTGDPRNTISYDQWPPSLQRASLGYGRVRIDPVSKTLVLVDGGGFGHWGITVAGTKGDETGAGTYAMKVEDGVWVWHELQ